jgi:hypothetical protein
MLSACSKLTNFNIYYYEKYLNLIKREFCEDDTLLNTASTLLAIFCMAKIKTAFNF